MSTTLSQSASSSLTEGSWIRFAGSAVNTGNTWVLSPTEDESAILELLANDVRRQFADVVVRVGAIIVNHEALKGYGTQGVPMSSSLAAMSECEDNSTACIGNTEICCHTGRIIGSCDGYWGCQ